MKFAIATVEFWESIGFDTENWRKSVDGTLAIVHLEYAEVLCTNLNNYTEIIIYDYPSEELDLILESDVWTPKYV